MEKNAMLQAPRNQKPKCHADGSIKLWFSIFYAFILKAGSSNLLFLQICSWFMHFHMVSHWGTSSLFTFVQTRKKVWIFTISVSIEVYRLLCQKKEKKRWICPGIDVHGCWLYVHGENGMCVHVCVCKRWLDCKNRPPAAPARGRSATGQRDSAVLSSYPHPSIVRFTTSRLQCLHPPLCLCGFLSPAWHRRGSVLSLPWTSSARFLSLKPWHWCSGRLCLRSSPGSVQHTPDFFVSPHPLLHCTAARFNKFVQADIAQKVTMSQNQCFGLLLT